MNLELYRNQIVEEIAEDPETDLLSNWRQKTDNLTQRSLVQIVNL